MRTMTGKATTFAATMGKMTTEEPEKMVLSFWNETKGMKMCCTTVCFRYFVQISVELFGSVHSSKNENDRAAKPETITGNLRTKETTTGKATANKTTKGGKRLQRSIG